MGTLTGHILYHYRQVFLFGARRANTGKIILL